ncbi:hypothetical protein P9112_012684 [Eukaryota sp. TZLM1-RC]
MQHNAPLNKYRAISPACDRLTRPIGYERTKREIERRTVRHTTSLSSICSKGIVHRSKLIDQSLSNESLIETLARKRKASIVDLPTKRGNSSHFHHYKPQYCLFVDDIFPHDTEILVHVSQNSTKHPIDFKNTSKFEWSDQFKLFVSKTHLPEGKVYLYFFVNKQPYINELYYSTVAADGVTANIVNAKHMPTFSKRSSFGAHHNIEPTKRKLYTIRNKAPSLLLKRSRALQPIDSLNHCQTNELSWLQGLSKRMMKEYGVQINLHDCALSNQNPRLRRLLSDERLSLDDLCRDNLCRETFQEYLCHILLWECDCKIYGGYVRDWVVGNQTANDIDCTCPTTDVKATIAQFLKSIQKSRFTCEKISVKRVNALCQRLKFKVGNYDMEVDFTAPGASRKIEGASPPFVEADVSNLQLCRTNYLSFKEPDASWNTDLSTVISHVMNQEFVFYYNLEKNPNQLYRLERRLKKGWVCLSKIPASYLHVFDGRSHLYQPRYE